MHHLAATEHHGDFDLVAFHQEFSSVVELEIQIVLVGSRSKLDFFERRRMGFLARTLLLLLIFVLAVIHDSTNGRTRIGGHLNEIQAVFTRNNQSVLGRHYTQLLAVGADNTDLADSNSFIDPGCIALWGYDSELRSNRYLTFLLRPMVSCDVRRLHSEALRLAPRPTSHPLPASIFAIAGKPFPARFHHLRSPG